MMKVLVVQPKLMHYRIPVYQALARSLPTTVIATGEEDQNACGLGFSYVPTRVIERFSMKWQRGVVSWVIKERPVAIWITADISYASSVLASIIARLLGARVLLHGQGVIKKSGNPLIRKLLLRAWLTVATKYVAYGECCRTSLLESGFPASKLEVINNRFEVSELETVTNLKQAGEGVLFVGRARAGSRIGWLVDTMNRINESRSMPVPLHIVGEGVELTPLKEEYGSLQWIHWYGEVTDPRELARIASSCKLAAYPGRAGLSVLTYMQFGLPVVIGDDISYHMGPEPAYVVEGETGWKFKFHEIRDFQRMMEIALVDPNLERMGSAAREFYEALHRKSYGGEMAELLTRGNTDE